MNTNRASAALAARRQLRVCIGQAALPLGQVTWARDGAREFSAFAYDERWLASRERFAISPDLPLVAGHQARRALTRDDSVFHDAFADTEPDAWGRRVIARAHAKARQRHAGLAALTALDYLSAVDDEVRVGALRLVDDAGRYLGTPDNLDQGFGRVPPLVDLRRLFEASRAVEAGTESVADLHYLQGKGTSLGGLRPKCSVLDVDGALALGKFPSIGDQRNVERGEVLALELARRAGIDAAQARIVDVQGTAVAVIRRFDRRFDRRIGGGPDGSDGRARIPYLSAASLLQASRHEERSYLELADAIRALGADPIADLRELWRRMLFNLLITNVDDHLRNHAFLHVARGQWRLAPAFDLNPFPDRERESKTWLSEAAGPITDVAMLLAEAPRFALPREAALAVLAEVQRTVAGWRRLALSAKVGLAAGELNDWAPAFEHAAMAEARRLLR